MSKNVRPQLAPKRPGVARARLTPTPAKAEPIAIDSASDDPTEAVDRGTTETDDSDATEAHDSDAAEPDERTASADEPDAGVEDSPMRPAGNGPEPDAAEATTVETAAADIPDAAVPGSELDPELDPVNTAADPNTSATPSPSPSPASSEPASTGTDDAGARTPVVAATPEPTPVPIEPGDLVELGSVVTLPTLTVPPRVRYPNAARRLRRNAKVRLRVLVDETGRAIDAELAGKPAGLGFDQAAIDAAKKTKWTIPKIGDVPVKVWVPLSIDFHL